MSVEVTLQLGHKAVLKPKPTPEGYTHDWTVFVQGRDGASIQHFVEKVVFHLHDSFPKPRRVIKEPPYSVSESGYAGFIMPIDIHFRSKEEPKKVAINYDLYLKLDVSPVNNIRLEKLTFQNPLDDFKQKLLKGGGHISNPSGGSSSSSGNSQLTQIACAPLQSDENSTKPIVSEPKVKKPKNHSLSKDLLAQKPPAPKPAPPPTAPKINQPKNFIDIFGPPIRTKSSPDPAAKTKGTPQSSQSKVKVSPINSSSSSKEAKPAIKELNKPYKESNISRDSSKESGIPPKDKHSSKEKHPKSNKVVQSKESHHSSKNPSISNKDHSSKESHHKASKDSKVSKPSKEHHNPIKEVSTKEPKPKDSAQILKQSKKDISPKDSSKNSHNSAKEHKEVVCNKEKKAKEFHSSNKESAKDHSSKSHHSSKHSKEHHSSKDKHTSKDAHRSSKDHLSFKESPKESRLSSKDASTLKESLISQKITIKHSPHTPEEPYHNPEELYHSPEHSYHSAEDSRHSFKRALSPIHSYISPKASVPLEESVSSHNKSPKIIKEQHSKTSHSKKKSSKHHSSKDKHAPSSQCPRITKDISTTESKDIKPSKIKVEKDAKPVKRPAIPDTHSMPTKKKKLSTSSSDGSEKCFVKSVKTKDESDDDYPDVKPFGNIKKEKDKFTPKSSIPNVPKFRPPSPPALASPMSSDSPVSDSDNESKHSSSIRAQYSSPASSISDSSLHSPPLPTISEMADDDLVSPLASDSDDTPPSPESVKSLKHSDSDSNAHDSEVETNGIEFENEPADIASRHSDNSPRSELMEDPHMDAVLNDNSRDWDEEHVQEALLTAIMVFGKDDLTNLQRRIMSSDDGQVLQSIVDIIGKTGKYEISPNTFEFDLCTLDPITVKKVKYCLI